MSDDGVLVVETGDGLGVSAVHLGDGVGAFRLRSLHGEGVDNSLILSGLFFILTEGVNDFTLLAGVVVELRHCHVSLAELCLADLVVNLAEVPCHLETCDGLVVLNGPVDRQLFARLNGNLVVAGLVDIGVVNGLAARNEIIDDGIAGDGALSLSRLLRILRSLGNNLRLSGLDFRLGGLDFRLGGLDRLSGYRILARIADIAGQRLGDERLSNLLAVSVNAVNTGLTGRLVRRILVAGIRQLFVGLLIEQSRRCAEEELIGVYIEDVLAVCNAFRQNEVEGNERGIICPLGILSPGPDRGEACIVSRRTCLNPCIVGVDVQGAAALELVGVLDHVSSLILDVECISSEEGHTAGLRIACITLHVAGTCQCAGFEAAGICKLCIGNGDTVVTESILIVLIFLIVVIVNSTLAERFSTVNSHLNGKAVETAGLRDVHSDRNDVAALRILDGIDFFFAGTERNDRAVDRAVCCSVCAESQSAAHSRRCDSKRRKSRDEFLHDNLILSGLIPGKPPSRSKRIVYLVLLGLFSAYLREVFPLRSVRLFTDYECCS